MIQKSTTNYFGLIALLSAGVGLLLFFEVVRPFRDMSIDGPIALAAWGIGVTLSIVALATRARWFAVNVIALVCNGLLLLGALALLYAISRSNFAWH